MVYKSMQSGENLKISVVVLSYLLEAPMIPGLIETLLDQSIPLKEYEIIVVTDRVDDQTERKINRFLKQYPDKIHFFKPSKENLGLNLGLKRNYGAKKAKAPLILFIDGDMLADKNLLKEHLKTHKKHEGSVLGYFNNVIIDDNQNISRRDRLFLEYIEESQTQNVFEGRTGDILDYRSFYTGNVSVKKEIFEKIGGFDENFTKYGLEDIDLGYRLAINGDELVLNRKARTIHRYSPNFNDFLRKRQTAGYSLGYFVDKYRHLYRHFRVTLADSIWFIIQIIALAIPGTFNEGLRKKSMGLRVQLRLHIGFMIFYIQNLSKYLSTEGEYLG